VDISAPRDSVGSVIIITSVHCRRFHILLHCRKKDRNNTVDCRKYIIYSVLDFENAGVIVVSK
jgi:hypothetical protein